MSRSLPLSHAAMDVDAALALVCSTPADGRNERRVSLESVVARSADIRDIEDGVSVAFDGSDETARLVVDLALAERACCAQFSYTIVFQPRAAAVERRVEASNDLVRVRRSR